jgi:hypothetical protein
MNDTSKPRTVTTPVKTDETPDNFLARWSQRKSDSARQIVDPPPAESPQPEPEPQVLTDEDMPPLESLGQDSDYSGFLSPGVSENLRQLALSKLFRSAKFNVVDNMNDYAEDYTKWVPLGDVVTCDMRFAMERAKEKLERALSEAGDDSSPDVKTINAEPEQDTLATDTDNSSETMETTETPDEPGTH